jgi:putative transposase
VRTLVGTMAAANPLWGAPRIHGELAKMGITVSFFTVPTLTGRVLFVLVLLSHQRRRIIHVNITEHPTAVWTAHIERLNDCAVAAS